MADTLNLPLHLLLALAVSTLGDALTYRAWRERLFGWGVMDGLQHGAVGLAVTLPILLRLPGLWPYLVAFAAATLVDVDHFMRFPRWWPMAPSDWQNRRNFHSLLVAVVVGSVAWVVGGSVAWGWLAFAGLLSHLLRDTTMGTVPIAFPVRFALKLGRPAYYVGEMLLCAASYLVAPSLSR
jgi:hypothetical protein